MHRSRVNTGAEHLGEEDNEVRDSFAQQTDGPEDSCTLKNPKVFLRGGPARGGKRDREWLCVRVQ